MQTQQVGKVCGRCHQRKPLSMFHKDKKSKKDGVGRICKECKLEWSRTHTGRKTRDQWRDRLIVMATRKRNAELEEHKASQPLRWLEQGLWLVEPRE